jgi:hypothetical protein
MFTMKVKTDNAAFSGEDKWYELARILKYVAQQIEDGHPGKSVQDSNGNTVGSFKLT